MRYVAFSVPVKRFPCNVSGRIYTKSNAGPALGPVAAAS